jgi:hypothetical protein
MFKSHAKKPHEQGHFFVYILRRNKLIRRKRRCEYNLMVKVYIKESSLIWTSFNLPPVHKHETMQKRNKYRNKTNIVRSYVSCIYRDQEHLIKIKLQKSKLLKPIHCRQLVS